MIKYNVIDLSGILWQSAQDSIAIADMDTDRLIRTYAWVCARHERLDEVKAEIHPYYHRRMFAQNGRSLQEWREIFAAAINARAVGEAKAEIARLESELAELEPPENRIEARRAEIARLKGLL